MGGGYCAIGDRVREGPFHEDFYGPAVVRDPSSVPRGVMRALLWVGAGGNRSPGSGLVQSSIARRSEQIGSERFIDS